MKTGEKSNALLARKRLNLEEESVSSQNGNTSLPAVIAGKGVTIKTDVVESDIPLLLSRQARKIAGVKMDLESDTAQILDIALNLTTSGQKR